MVGDGDCGVIGGIKIGRGNLSTRRKNLPQHHSVHHKSHIRLTLNIPHGMKYLSRKAVYNWVEK
jgi:hypothetical protein